MSERRYTKEHHWISIESDIATVGITDYLLENISNISYIQLPEINDLYNKHDVIGVIEMEEGELELTTPIEGEILEINELLVDSPESLIGATQEDSWLVRVFINKEEDLEETMTKSEYKEYVYELME